MTAPAQQDRLTAAQLATLLALVKAQAAVRQRLTNTAVAAAVTAFQGISNWWLAGDVNQAITAARRIITPTQQQAARITSSYMAQTSGVIAGRSFRPAKTIDVSKLRKDMTPEQANELLDGIRVPAWVVLGDSHDGPAHTIDDPAALAAAGEPRWLDAADPYGRVADGYRYNVTMRGDSEEVAGQKAIVRIANVAETDVTLAVRKQYHESMSAHGAIGWRRILHPELSQTGPCALCVVAADRLYHKEDLLPIHGHCFPAGVMVSGPAARSAVRRPYTGELVTVWTASGCRLPMTANHPVLTTRGWVAAGRIGVGDALVATREPGGVRGIVSDRRQSVRPIEELWAGFSRSAPMLVRASDFHGDGVPGSSGLVRFSSSCNACSTSGRCPSCGSRPDSWAVGGRATSPRTERLHPGTASTGRRPAPRLRASRSLPTRRRTTEPASGGSFPGGPRGAFGTSWTGSPSLALAEQRVDFVLWHSGHPGADRGSPRGLHAAGPADLLGPSDLRRLSLDAHAHSTLRTRRSSGTSLDVAHSGCTCHQNTVATGTAHWGATDTPEDHRIGAALLARLQGRTTLDTVVAVERKQWSGDVYSLTTAEGWHTANGLVVSNCVCEVLPVYQGADPGITLNGDDLRALYDAAGGNTRQALRKVTVALAEHAELGPILVDANQNNRGPVEYAANKTDRAHVRYLAQLGALEKLHDTTKYRISRGDDLDRSFKAQASRIEELKHLTGVS